MEKKRLIYIDFIKGICMLRIIMVHINDNMLPMELKHGLQVFTIPMFFFLSGLFFREQSSAYNLLRKKINNYIIPFVFFYLLACVIAIITSGVLHLERYGLMSDTWEWSYLFDPLFVRKYHYNIVLWFLLSLFEVNVIYYVLHRYLREVYRAAIVVVLALVGWYMSANKIELPLMLDTAFVGLPFYYVGTLFVRYFPLTPTKYDKWGLVVFPIVFVACCLLGEVNMVAQILPAYYLFYPLAIVAVLSFFWFSKNIQVRIPIITYVGRYSIILLCTHSFLLAPAKAIYKVMPNERPTYWVIFGIVVLIELAVIPLMIKWFPYFTAQKELIKERK